MTDEKYTFIQTVKERKALVPSATKKPRKNYCSLPSDYMTKKEKMSMNGEVIAMKFNHRYTWEQLKVFDSDLQKEYFTHIFTLYKVTEKQVSQMLEIHPTYSYRIFRNLGITPKKLRMSPNYQALPWDTFGDVNIVSPKKAAVCISNMSITIKATSWQELYDTCKNLPFPTNEIRIMIERCVNETT